MLTIGLVEQEKYIVDTEFLAEFFDCEARTIQLWAADEKNPLPKEGRDKYNLESVLRWRLATLKKEVEILKTSGDKKLHAMKIRGQEIKNKKDEIELKKSLSKLVDKKTTLIAWSNQMNILKGHANAIRFELATALNLSEEDTKTLNKIIDSFQDTVSRTEIEKYIINEEALLDEEPQENL